VKVVALLSFGLVLLLAPLAQARTERVAIVVGSNGAPSGRVPLRYAHDDARAVASVLTEVGDYRAEDVHVLLDPSPGRVLDEIERAVAHLGAAPESLVLFYYSGHSDSDALYPNGQPLSLRVLRQSLDDPRVSVRLGVIDSCRGGGWTGSKGLQASEPFAVDAAGALSNVGSALIASSSGLEDAHESEALGGSFFTHHFTAGLRGAADDNHDRRVTLVEAFEYARSLTIRDTALVAATPQHPSFRMNLLGRQDLPLTNLERGESWMALAQEAGPLQVVHLQSGAVLAELPAGSHAVRIALPPGRYLVRRRADSHTYAKEYQVPAGEVTRVTESDLELIGETRLALKGDADDEWRVNYYLLGALGSQHGLGFSMSNAQYGRVAPSEAPLMGFTSFGAVNTGLGLEVSVPGRVAWRLGKGNAVEWVPWLGVPWYWVPDAEGDLRFHAGIGLGLDTWLRLDGRSRVGLSLGASAMDPSAGNRLDAWAAVGYERRIGERWAVSLGLGYTHSIGDDDLRAIADQRGVRDRISIGSVATDGVLPLPLLEYRVDETLSVGASAQLDYHLSDESFGYAATFGWTWRFGKLDMTVR
jgi:caspase domain-containing protein